MKIFYTILLLLFCNLVNAQLPTKTPPEVPAANIIPEGKPSPIVNVIPPSPEAASLGKYGAVPVSLYSGIPSINIPLYSFSRSWGEVSIGLSYHSGGVKVDELSSSVGIGWSLQAGGVITRTVHGNPDEQPEGYQTSQMQARISRYRNGEMSTAESKEFEFLVADGIYDTEPDEYFYNFLGRSGRMVFDLNGQPILLDHSMMKIAFNGTSFTITDEQGTIYSFTETETVRPITRCVSTSSPTYTATSGWWLTEVKPLVGNSVIFSYKTLSNVTYDQGINENRSFKIGGPLPYCEDTPVTTCISSFQSTMKLIQTITFDLGQISFSYENRVDTGPAGQRLKNVSVTNKLGLIIKQYQLAYLYGGGNTRFALTDIIETTDPTRPGPRHQFSYYRFSDLPARNTKAQDHWGFYNSNTASTMIPFINLPGNPGGYNWANREADAEKSKFGTLTQIKYPTGGTTDFIYEGHDYGYVFLMTGAVKAAAAGGVRIKRIIDKSSDDPSKDTYTTYEYRIRNEPDRSSGVLIQQFAYQYDYTTSTLYTSGENTTPFDVTCTFRAASSNSQAYLGSTQGSHIGYEEVTVYHGQDQTSGGKTWHRFTTYRDNPDTYPQGSADQLPFPPPTSKDAFRGLELEAIDYIYENNNFRALRKKNNFYTFSEINIVLGIKMMFSFKSPGGSYQSLVGVSNYGFCRTWVKLDRQTEELYDSSEPQVSETQFTYSPINLQILSRQQTLSNEDKLTTRYVYPQNLVISAFPSPSSELLAIKKLQEKNVVNAILEETQTLKKKNSSTEILISGTYTSFKSDQIGLKESVWQIETVNPLTTWSNITVQSNGTVGKDSRYRELIKFERYDEYGNLAQQRLTNDFPTAYVWSHDGALLAGEIKNALYDQVKSALGSDYNLLSTGTLPDNSVLNIWNNKIRNNSLFSTAFVTTFTHKPLVGISSQSDNAGLNTYYNYDSFNRLSAIKDHNQNLVKTFHYNYGLTGSIDDPTLISPNFRRIVIVGNSITKLQAQSGTDGWQSPALSASGGWGRASSTLNNDFAHILESRFKQLNPAAQVLPLWEAPFERNYVSNTAGWISYNYAGLKNRITLGFGLANPDLVIIRLGENILNTTVESDNFKGALNTLIDNVLAVSTPGAKVLLTNSIWPDQPLANAKIQEVANERNFLFVDLSDMYYNPVFLAGNDPAVLTVFPNNIDDIHPGDVGMMEIADRIWGKLLGENKNASANQSACTEPSVTITSPIEGTVPGTTIPGNSGLIMPITMSVCVPSGQSVVRVDVIAKTPDGSVQRRVGIAKAVAGSPGTYRIDAVMVGNGVEGGWLPTIGGNNYPGNPNAQTGPLAPNATFVYWAELVTSAGGTPIESPEVSVLMTPPTSIASKARIQVRGDHDFVLDRYSGGKFEGSNDLNSWQLLYTIPVTPRPTLSQWVDCPFAVNTQAYRYLRFKSSENGYGELAEIEFYDGSTKLTGSWTGSPGRTYPDYPTAYPLSNAYDGNSSTFWHGNSAGIQNWIMLDTQGGSTPQTATVTITSPIEGTVPGTTVSGNSGLIMPITMSVSLPSGQSVVRVDVIAKTPDGSVQRRVGIAKAVAGSPGTYRIDAVMVGNGVEGGWLPTIGGDNYPGNPNAQTGPLAPNATFVYWAELVTSAGGTPIESPEVSVLMTPLTSIASKARIQVRGDHDFVLDRYSGGKFEGSNDLNSWQLLYTIPVTPRPTLSQWVDCPFTGNPQSYRYLRYTAGSTSAGELAEIEFYDGSTKLTGSWTGSPGRTYPDYPTAYPLSNAYDGNSSTFWHGNSAGIQNWIMLDTQGGSTPQAASVTITSPIEGTVPGTTIPGNSGLIMPITMSVSLPSGQSVVRVDVIAKTPDGSVQRRVGIAKAVAGSPGTYRIDAVMVGNGVEGGWLPTIGGDNYPGNPNAQTGPLAPNATFVYWAELVTSAGGTPIESPEVSILMTPPASVATKARILTRQDFNYTNRFNGAVFEGATSLSGPWQTLVAINSSNLPSWTTYKEYEFTGNTQTYRYLRFKSSGSGYGELAEIEFYNGSTKLTGSWRAFDDRASYPLTNAYDGNSSTFWHGVSLGSQNWIMLDTQGQSNATSAITTPTNGSSVVGSPAQGYSGLYIMPITVVTQVPAGQTITRVDIVARTTSGSVVQRRIGTASPVPGSPGTYRVNASMVANGQSGGWLPPMAGEYPINPGAQFGPLAPNANFWYWAEVTTSPDNQIIKSPAVTATMTLSQ